MKRIANGFPNLYKSQHDEDAESMNDGLKHEAYLTLAPDVAMATALMMI